MSSGASLLIIRVLNIAVGFATVTIFVRFLAPEQYGFYVICMTTAQFLALPLQMGLPTLLQREVAIAIAEGRPAAARGVIAWSGRVMLLVFGVLAAVVLAAYTIVERRGWEALDSFTLPVVLLILGFVAIIAFVHRARGALLGFKHYLAADIPDSLIRPALLLVLGLAWLTLFDASAPGLLAVHFVALAVAGLVAWTRLVRAQADKLDGGSALHVSGGAWLRAIVPLTFFAAATTISAHVDVLMLGFIVDAETAGFYRLAAQLAALALMAQVAMNAVVGASMADSFARNDKAGMQRTAVLASLVSAALAVGFAVVLLLVGRDGFSWVFGADYLPAYGLALFLCVGNIGNTMFGGTVMLMNMSRQEKTAARYAIWTALFNVGLNATLIPIFGAHGAVGATIATTMVMQVMAWQRIRHTLGVRTDVFAWGQPT